MVSIMYTEFSILQIPKSKSMLQSRYKHSLAISNLIVTGIYGIFWKNDD